MDATAVLALTTKIGQVFHWKNSTLAYPIGFIAYDASDFNGITDPPGDITSLQNLSEFSRLVNLRPDGSVWNPSDSVPLWSVVSDIYASAVVAESRVYGLGDERVAFAAPTGSSSSAADDAVQLKYKQFEDRWNLLVQRYRVAEAQVTSDSHEDSSLQSLRKDIAVLENEWREHGHKGQVEAPPLTFGASATINFNGIWEEWKATLIESVDYQTDGQGNRYVPTVYTPGNIVESPSWVSIELDGKDVQSMLDQSDPDLARRFGYTQGDETSIRRIRFEATSVDVVRSWLPHDLLTARFWRFPNPEKTVDWPGYVTGLVLLRNIEIITETQVEPEFVDAEVMIEGEHPSSSGEPRRGPDPVRARRYRWIVLAIGFFFSLILAVYLGGKSFVPTFLAVPIATALFYGLYLMFGLAMRRRLFRTSRFVTGLGWFIFTAFSVTLVFGLLSFNMLYGSLEAGVPLETECSHLPPTATVKEKFGAAIGCIFVQAVVLLIGFSLLLLLVAVSSVVLLIVWLFTRYQPIRRTSRYFRQKVQPAVFDRIGEDADREIRLDADRYSAKIFIAGFRTQSLGRVPDLDTTLRW